MNEACGWSNFFQIHLNKLGNDAYEIVANAEPLQSAWAKEHGLNLSGEDLLLEQFKFYKPDVIFFQDSLSFSYSFIRDIEKNYPESDFIFIGSFIGNRDFHNDRIKLIESLLCKKVNLSLYTNFPNDN